MPEHLPPASDPGYVYFPKSQLAAMVRQIEKLEGELAEIADNKARDMLAPFNFRSEVNIEACSMAERLIIRVEPIQYAWATHQHPLDRTGAAQREAIIQQLTRHVAQRFAHGIFHQWEQSQRYS